MKSKSWKQRVGITAVLVAAIVAVQRIFAKPKIHVYQEYVDRLQQGLGFDNPYDNPNFIEYTDDDMMEFVNVWTQSLPPQTIKIFLRFQRNLNSITYKGWSAFIKAFANGPPIKSLIVALQLEPQEVEALATAIKNNKIQELIFQIDLSSNDLATIVDAVQQSNYLDELYFEKGDVLPNVLELFSTLKSITFGVSHMSNQDALDIAQAIRNSSTIEKISIYLSSDNDQIFTVNENGMQQIKNAFDQSKTIKEISFISFGLIPSFPKKLPGWKNIASSFFIERNDSLPNQHQGQ